MWLNSIIETNRFVVCCFCCCRNWFQNQNSRTKRKEDQTTNMGYSRSGEISHNYHLLLPWCDGYNACLWHNEREEFREYCQMVTEHRRGEWIVEPNEKAIVNSCSLSPSLSLFLVQHANEDVEKMILGNKCDMADKRVVSKERGEAVSRNRSREQNKIHKIISESVYLSLPVSLSLSRLFRLQGNMVYGSWKHPPNQI